MKRIFVSLALVGLLSMTVLGVAAADTTVVVTEGEIVRQAEGIPPANNWVMYTRNAGSGTFVEGPGTPPLPTGSLQLTTPTGADKVYLFNYDHIGTELDTINAMSYSTYRIAENLQQVPALNIEIDFNGAADGGYAVLVYEPVYNTDDGAVLNDKWQTWDAYNGGNAVWWSSKAIPGVCAFTCYVSWSTILENNPDATISGGFGVNQGTGNPGLDAAVDALKLGSGGDTITYDFEPPIVSPETKKECKKGGWENVTREDGTAFKNQGDCIQYVNTGK